MCVNLRWYPRPACHWEADGGALALRPSCGISYPRCRSDSRLISINPFRHAIRQKIMRLDGRRRLSGIVVQNRVADWSRAPQGCVVVPGRRPNHVGGARFRASRGVGAADRGKAVSWKAALYLIGLERSGPGSSRSCNLRTAGEASEALWRRPRSHPSRSAHPVSRLQPWIERREARDFSRAAPLSTGETDSPLEEAVSSEPVSENRKFPASWVNTGKFIDFGL